MINELLKDTEERMKATIKVLEQDMQGIRTGRASTGLVEKLQVSYYGADTPLMQLASISVPDPQSIMISPYDKSTLGDIERAILASDLGMTPNNDGVVIRLNVPALTKERRKDMVKIVHRRVEDAKVSIRNVRRHAIDDAKEFEKESMISEDELHGAQGSIQKLTDKYVKEIDDIGKRKEAEIMEV